MKRVWKYSLAACAVLLMAPAAQATTFTLGFGGSGDFTGGSGDSWGADYFCTLQGAGGGTGAQGWSLSMTADNALISAITIEGTDAKTLYNEGFKKSETTSGAGNEGAVSAVVLSLQEAASLPADSTSTVAKITVGGLIPAVNGTATLRYINGRKGSGQKVDNNVTQDGNTVTPVLSSKTINLKIIKSCCNGTLNVGFTAGKKTLSATPYDGILDENAVPANCSGGGGNITTEVARDATGERHAYANISSKAADPLVDTGAQGWSFSIALNGDIEFGAGKVTVAGTSVDNYYSEGFKKTEVIDPARNPNPPGPGQRGAVSAVVLSLQEARNLPPTGTETVLDLDIVANAKQGDADIKGEVRFQTDLRGSGQKVQNALTVNGNTVDACNFATAKVDLIFKIVAGRSFTRGNANGDAKVNIADPIWIINLLFRSGPSSGCDAASDANGDGKVDASDATFLIDYEFGGKSPPPGSFPACETVSPTLCNSDQVCTP